MEKCACGEAVVNEFYGVCLACWDKEWEPKRERANEGAEKAPEAVPALAEIPEAEVPEEIKAAV